MSRTLHILQITDLHLLAEPDARLIGVDTADSLRAVLRCALSGRAADAVVATGDITQHGEAAAYARFDTILQEFHQGPLLVIPGNHDLNEPMARYAEENLQLRFPGWELIGVDSHVDEEVGAAALELERLQERCLAAAATGRSVLLFVHHPVVDVNCPWLDKDRIQNADELLEWLAAESSVVAVVFGHAHQVVERSHQHIRLLGTPATCFQFLPESGSFAIDQRAESAMPGFRWLTLEPDGALTTQVGRVLDYPLQITLPPGR